MTRVTLASKDTHCLLTHTWLKFPLHPGPWLYTYIHIAILHLGDSDRLDMPDKLSLGNEPVLPGQVAHTEGGDVSQEDAVKLKGVCGPPTGNKVVINELSMPVDAVCT